MRAVYTNSLQPPKRQHQESQQQKQDQQPSYLWSDCTNLFVEDETLSSIICGVCWDYPPPVPYVDVNGENVEDCIAITTDDDDSCLVGLDLIDDSDQDQWSSQPVVPWSNPDYISCDRGRITPEYNWKDGYPPRTITSSTISFQSNMSYSSDEDNSILSLQSIPLDNPANNADDDQLSSNHSYEWPRIHNYNDNPPTTCRSKRTRFPTSPKVFGWKVVMNHSKDTITTTSTTTGNKRGSMKTMKPWGNEEAYERLNDNQSMDRGNPYRFNKLRWTYAYTKGKLVNVDSSSSSTKAFRRWVPKPKEMRVPS